MARWEGGPDWWVVLGHGGSGMGVMEGDERVGEGAGWMEGGGLGSTVAVLTCPIAPLISTYAEIGKTVVSVVHSD